MKSVRAFAHPGCIVCSPANPLGLNLEFTLGADGVVEGTFASSTLHQGYPGLLHGGVVAALLDGAMTNCLFARGRRGVTAELRVRYRGGIAAGQRLTVRAWEEGSRHGLHKLRSELLQEGEVKAVATAKFMEKYA